MKERTLSNCHFSLPASIWLTELNFYDPPNTKQFILEVFFPANLLAQYWITTSNTTIANMHL